MDATALSLAKLVLSGVLSYAKSALTDLVLDYVMGVGPLVLGFA